MSNVGTTEEQKLPMISAVNSLSSPDGSNTLSQGIGNTDINNKKESVEVGKSFDDNSRSNLDYTPRKATARRSCDSRLPAVKSTSVFDRLYKSHTVASKSRTLSSRAKLKPSTRAKLAKRNTSGISIDVEKDLLNFNHISISRSSKVSTPHKIQLESKGGKGSAPFSFSTPQPKKQLSSYGKAPRTAPSKSSINTFTSTPRSSKRIFEFSPRMKPLTKLYFASKFHPGVGPEPIEPISLGYTFFQTFCEYETGGIDSEHIAKEIFIAFFKKDLSQGIRHWKLHEPVLDKNSESPRSRHDGTAYPLTMNATYSWGNTYRVAHAKGVVRFKGSQNREIMVENFTYNLTGDP